MPYADINGIRMHYGTAGKGDPIVLITGLAGDMGFWNRTVPMLEDSRTVITVDNRGSGSTEYRGRFKIPDMADDVVALLDHLGIAKSHILGWSMGSHIALDIAARYPERVRTLTIASCYLRRPARSAYILNHLAEGYAAGTVSAETIGKTFNVLLRTSGFFRDAEITGRKIGEMAAPDPEGFISQMHAVEDYDVAEDAVRVKVPTLSVHGLEDIMTEPSEGDAVADVIAGCERVRLPGEGHLLRPESYMPALKEFLSRH